MAAQPIPIDPLGENPIERRTSVKQRTETKSYFQILGGAGALVGETLELARPSAYHEVLVIATQAEFPTLVFAPAFPEFGARARLSQAVIEEIDALRAGREDEAIPTDFAYKSARSIVEAAYGEVDTQRRAVPEIFPKPYVTTDDVGGIRLLWDLGSKKLRANFGARLDLQTYLYYEGIAQHGAEPLNVESLKSRLNWLTER